MCGIAGILRGPNARGGEPLAGLLAKMGRSLRHRGPDGDGLWIDDAQRIGLTYRRLAVIDPSAAGHQPVVTPSGRQVLIYNGEIYNHLELRRRIERETGYSGWRGRSDTETLAAAIDYWGIEPTLARLEGMFAFACWDREHGRLLLARDRLGEKPLHYGRVGGPGGDFVFASELKALRAHPGFDASVDRDSLALFMRHGCVPGDRSIFAGIRKLPPGCTATVELGAAEPEIRSHWSLRQHFDHRSADAEDQDPDAGGERLERLLRDVVRDEMAADVAVGAFLSGGVDSSTIVALMQQQSGERVKTFSLGFEEKAFDEAPAARAVARHLGTDHRELIMSATDAAAVIPTLPAIYDEPFADPSAIPTLLLCRLAREDVTVALGGDGADELFGGYHSYRWASSLAPLLNLPRGLRSSLAVLLARATDPASASRLGPLANHSLVRRVNRAADLLTSENPEHLYRRLAAAWRRPDELVVGSAVDDLAVPTPAPGDLAGIERMMAIDLVSYLPDDILVKIDRAAMHCSLETRSPFLHPHILGYALRSARPGPGRGRRSKWPLRQIAYKYVPRALLDRPKQGFAIPVAQWLRGPLRDWAEQSLDPGRLRREGFLRAEPVRLLWQAHLAGRDEHVRLWPVLIFQSWLEKNRESA